MNTVNDVAPASSSLGSINMASPLPLQDWNASFTLSTPGRPSPRQTPSKTNWKLGAPQRTPQSRTPGPARTPILSTRRVQQGASLASTPAQSGQRLLPKSRTGDLIAPSLANLPNALSAEYWLRKIQLKEQLGDYDAARDLFELAIKRDVRPATTMSRAFAEFLTRHSMPAATGLVQAAAPASCFRQTPARPRTQFVDDDQENASQNIISPKAVRTAGTKSRKNDQQARRQSHVHFQTPEANVVSEAADPDQDERNNSSRAGSTPFHAKSLRRVCFAATDQATDQPLASQAAANVPADTPKAASTFVLAQRWLDTSASELLFPDDQPIDAAGLGTVSSDACERNSGATADASSSGAVETEGTDSDDNDGSNSIGTVSVAAGSTPYLHRSMLSAALKAATPLESHAEDGMNHTEGAALSNMMGRLLSEELEIHDKLSDMLEDHEQTDQQQILDSHKIQASMPHRPDSLLASALSPETGAIHLTPIALPRVRFGVEGNAADAAYTPAAITALSTGGEEAMTPLCLDLDKLQLSAVSSWPAAFTPANGDNGSANSDPLDAFSLPSKVASAGATPAMRGSTGWNRSIFETPGETMSPELLGWHERQSLDHVQSMSAATSSGSQDVKPEQPLSSFQFMRAPASALKSNRAADSSALGKAVRVKTPANRPKVGKSELKSLVGNSPTRTTQDMGSIALLSPVRADSRLNHQLGAAKVVTPVRRSARKSLATPLIASMLRDTEFAYAPNEALSRRRHPIFESPLPVPVDESAVLQDEEDKASTSISVTGVSLAVDLSIPAESAFLQAEASAATYSSSRLSSRSHSPLPQTPPDSSMLLEAALSPDLGVDIIPHYGALHQLHAGSSFGSGADDKVVETETFQEVINADVEAGLVTPPPSLQSRVSPQGPTTRSKSNRKVQPIAVPASTGSRRRQTVDSPSLSPTEAKIRDGLRRSARLQKEAKSSA